MKQAMTQEKMGQILYMNNVPQVEQTDCRAITWERTSGIPNWLENVSNWVEVLVTGAMTAFSVYWMWYCMVCV